MFTPLLLLLLLILLFTLSLNKYQVTLKLMIKNNKGK